ncbi:MAG: hypothetical protein RJB34_1570 [Pseudomonadota bacterium]|jgi:hypothetical protein
MNINLTHHRQARQAQQRRRILWRCGGALAVGLLLSFLPVWWAFEQRKAEALAWQAAQAESQALAARQAQWDTQTQEWAVWAAQRQAWLAVGQASQMPLRVWRWLDTANVHGVRWTQWQHDAGRWSVAGEASSLTQVRVWLDNPDHRPMAEGHAVALTQTGQSPDGRVGFLLSWQETP